MLSFSVWHLLIVLLFFGIPAVAIAMASPEKKLNRQAYFWRVLGILAAGFLVYLASGSGTAEESPETTVLIALAGLVANLILIVLNVLWSVHRTQDIGRSKWWCLLLILPIVNLAFIAFLLFYPGQDSGEQPA